MQRKNKEYKNIFLVVYIIYKNFEEFINKHDKNIPYQTLRKALTYKRLASLNQHHHMTNDPILHEVLNFFNDYGIVSFYTDGQYSINTNYNDEDIESTQFSFEFENIMQQENDKNIEILMSNMNIGNNRDILSELIDGLDIFD